MKNNFRSIFTALVIGLVPICALEIKGWYFSSIKPEDLVWPLVVGSDALMIAISALFAAVVIVPIFRMLELRKILNILSVLLMGFLAGLMPIFILCALTYLVDGKFITDPIWAAWAEGLSVLAILCGWIVWCLLPKGKT